MRLKRLSVYRYDPFGRRISKTTTQGGNSQTTYYAYGSSGLLAEMNEQGAITKAYGWNPQAAGLWSTAPLWQTQVGNNSLSSPSTGYHYLHTDHLETPVLGTDKSGMQTWKAISEAFGETKVDTASAITMNLRFAGQYFDGESGLHQNYFRDYKPGIGRYIQSDPIGLAGGINTFGYVGGNPLSLTDPRGLDNPGMGPYGPQWTPRQSVDYYINLWVCKSNSWQDAFDTASSQKFGPADDDERTAAEHYIFGRLIRADGGVLGNLNLWTGQFWPSLYQGAKWSGAWPGKTSPASELQWWWGNQAWVDSNLDIRRKSEKRIPSNPGECGCP